jgi:hypothetical protein
MYFSWEIYGYAIWVAFVLDIVLLVGSLSLGCIFSCVRCGVYHSILKSRVTDIGDIGWDEVAVFGISLS